MKTIGTHIHKRRSFKASEILRGVLSESPTGYDLGWVRFIIAAKVLNVDRVRIECRTFNALQIVLKMQYRTTMPLRPSRCLQGHQHPVV